MSAYCRRCGGELTGRQTDWCSDQCRKRASECGGRMKTTSSRCRRCYDTKKAAATALQREMIAEMWEAGASYKAIAQALGRTCGSIHIEIVRMRADGWDLTRRGPGGVALVGGRS